MKLLDKYKEARKANQVKKINKERVVEHKGPFKQTEAKKIMNSRRISHKGAYDLPKTIKKQNTIDSIIGKYIM